MNTVLKNQEAGSKRINRYRDQLFELITPIADPLNLDIVQIEILNQREAKLRVFIEREDRLVNIDDCAELSRVLGESLDQNALIEEIFQSGYDLEVSSPGVYRPLWREADFTRFRGERIKVQTFRPLKTTEIENELYLKKNSKQKKFLGILEGIENEKIALKIEQSDVKIPLSLVTKANLEPVFEW